MIHPLRSWCPNRWTIYLLGLVPLSLLGCVMYQPTAASVPGMSFDEARLQALQLGRAHHLTDIQIRDQFIDFQFQPPNQATKRISCRREDIDPSITDTIGPPYILSFGDRCDPNIMTWDFEQARRLADALYMIRQRATGALVEGRKTDPPLWGGSGVSPDR